VPGALTPFEVQTSTSLLQRLFIASLPLPRKSLIFVAFCISILLWGIWILLCEQETL